MSPTTAKRLYDSGAFVVMLDVPKGTEFGIDFPSWNVGERLANILAREQSFNGGQVGWNRSCGSDLCPWKIQQNVMSKLTSE